MKIFLQITPILFTMLLAASCQRDSINTDGSAYGIFSIMEDNTAALMNGEVTSGSLEDYDQLISDYPDIKTIFIQSCEGSNDDDINLAMSLKVHRAGIDTHLMDQGVIASGGTDFFLAGNRRTIGTGVQIGVHSWAGDGSTATDFPVGHANHLTYIDYYKDIGFTQSEAEAFYYFTINAAVNLLKIRQPII